jgi:succinoglycan biosynthesis protein ExoV
MKLIHYRGATPNFGDDLNGVLWTALEPGLIDDDPADAFVGIGTIIGMECAAEARLHVFSSGIGNDPIERWRDRQVTYWCVRGPISRALLGLPAETVITDGAILVPMAAGFPQAATPGTEILVIPHFQTIAYPGWDKVAAQTGFQVLDPRADPHSVITRIAQARLVLTESLHGAVIADTYGIPWAVFATSGNFGSTKFVDWCGSLGLEFTMTYVPPPNALQVLEQGQGPCVWGQTSRVTHDDALAALGRRLAPARPQGLRGRIKAQIQKNRLLQPLLGYSPARTAAALSHLADGPLHLSAETNRRHLQERMMTRLREISAYRSGAG